MKNLYLVSEQERIRARSHDDAEPELRINCQSNRIQAARRDSDNSGLSREELAERIGKSLSGYSNYEAGRRELPQSARLAIMDSLGVDPLSTEALQSALTEDIIPEHKTPQHISHTSAGDHPERHELRGTTAIIQGKNESTGLIRAARLYTCKMRSWRQT